MGSPLWLQSTVCIHMPQLYQMPQTLGAVEPSWKRTEMGTNKDNN